MLEDVLVVDGRTLEDVLVEECGGTLEDILVTDGRGMLGNW